MPRVLYSQATKFPAAGATTRLQFHGGRPLLAVQQAMCQLLHMHEGL